HPSTHRPPSFPTRRSSDLTTAGAAKQARGIAQMCFWKVRMIKTDDRDFQHAPDRDRLPPDLVRIARFDDIRPVALDNFLDRAQVEQRTIARRTRNQWRTDRVDARPAIRVHFRFRARHNQHMLIMRRVLVDVGRLFVQVALYPAAKWRIKLGEIADFQKRQAPTTKHQRSSKRQSSRILATRFGIW